MTITDVGQLGTILGVWAHPDDEAYLTSGIMAVAVQNGQRVVCVTATRGEAGSQDEERWPTSQIAQIREAELEESLRILGVTEHHYLDYIDGRCEEVDDDEATAKIAAFIGDIQPRTVLTFGPLGGTGHPDHIAVSRWTTAAFATAAPAGASLYYASNTPSWVERFEPLLRPFNVWDDRTPEVTPEADLGVYFTCSDDVLDLKAKALLAQVSQTEGLWNAVGLDRIQEMGREEMFSIGMKK
jgi:LmbE family N-acetylglucosaminyl deacetylase